MDTIKIDNLIGQMRAAAALAAGQGASPPAGAIADTPFGQVLKEAVTQVNDVQQEAAQLAQRYETGAPDVNLQDVMISMSKANVSFQSMIQVRNRMVSAYHDIMNMQV